MSANKGAIDDRRVAVGACTDTADCDDGDECTDDVCSDGACTSTLFPDFGGVECEIDALIALLGGPACGPDPLAWRLQKKLTKKLSAAKARLAHADAATRTKIVERLIAKGDNLLATVLTVIRTAVPKGSLSAACGDALTRFVANLRVLVSGLPRS